MGVCVAACGHPARETGDAGPTVDGSFDTQLDARTPPAECTVSGALDQTFGTNGVASFGISSSAVAVGVAPGPSGTLIVGGEGFWPGDGDNSECFVMRVTAHGELDPTFGSGGITRVEVPDRRCNVFDMTVQSDGKIVTAGMVAGSDGVFFSLVRILPDGGRDPSFGLDGVIVDVPRQGAIHGVTVDGQDRILAGASAGDPQLDAGVFTVLRYTRDGLHDATFGTNGLAATAFNAGHDGAADIAVLPSGKIVAVGEVKASPADDVAIVRFLDNGSLDPTFGTSGTATHSYGSDSTGGGVAIDAAGSATVVGGTRAERWDSNGVFDPTFGLVLPSGLGMYRIAIASDGRFVAGGSLMPASSEALAVGRFDATGTWDPTFGSGGVGTAKYGFDLLDAYDVAIQPDGKIVAVGSRDNPNLAQQFPVVARFCP